MTVPYAGDRYERTIGPDRVEAYDVRVDGRTIGTVWSRIDGARGIVWFWRHDASGTQGRAGEVRRGAIDALAAADARYAGR